MPSKGINVVEVFKDHHGVNVKIDSKEMPMGFEGVAFSVRHIPPSEGKQSNPPPKRLKPSKVVIATKALIDTY